MLASGTAQAQPQVLASIKPLQLIAQAILGEQRQAQVLLPPGATPHHYSMRPSDMLKVDQAELIIWLGAESEHYLAKPIAKLKEDRAVLELESYLSRDKDGIPDPHLWLSGRKAISVAEDIAEQLIRIDSEREQIYRDNLRAFIAALSRTENQIASELAASKPSYLVYHDAYRYFEQEYGLSHRGVVSLHPEVNPGAKHMLALTRIVENEEVKCILVEPESNRAILNMLMKEGAIKAVELDPMASDIESGPSGYIHFLRRVADMFLRCQ